MKKRAQNAYFFFCWSFLSLLSAFGWLDWLPNDFFLPSCLLVFLYKYLLFIIQRFNHKKTTLCYECYSNFSDNKKVLSQIEKNIGHGLQTWHFWHVNGNLCDRRYLPDIYCYQLRQCFLNGIRLLNISQQNRIVEQICSSCLHLYICKKEIEFRSKNGNAIRLFGVLLFPLVI